VGLPVRARPAAERIPSLYEARSDNEVAARVAELRARVEREDAAGAEALLRGMLQAGWEQRQVQAALYALVADHFLDFGHPLIYVKKTLDLLDATRWANADSLLGGLVFGIVSGTREDLLPPWAAFRRRWDEWAATALPTLPPPESRTRDRQIEEDLVLGLRTGSPGEAFAAFAARLEAGDWTSAVNALSLAAADRLLRFEPAHDADPTIEEGWLHVTHRLTVANAVRHAVVRAEPRDAARILLMAVHFVRLAVGLDGAESTEPPADGATPDPRALRQRVLAGRAHRPIFWAHDVKTLVAAEEEARFLGDDRPLRAAARYLGHPLQERVIARFAHEAARLVRDGKPPRQLSG
jgi:hypothetical protein